jgi:hypothetical protein
MRRGIRTWLAVLAVLPGTTCTGCDKDPGALRFRLRITSDARIPEELSRVEVWVTAARVLDAAAPGEYVLCFPVVRMFDLREEADLPIYVDFYPGLQYGHLAAVRVKFWAGTRLIGVWDHIARLDDPGTEEYGVNLDQVCAQSAVPCDPGLWCMDGVCVDPGGGGIFEQTELIECLPLCQSGGTPADVACGAGAGSGGDEADGS